MMCVCGEGPGGGRILSAFNLFFGKVWSNTNSRSGWWEMSENNQLQSPKVKRTNPDPDQERKVWGKREVLRWEGNTT